MLKQIENDLCQKMKKTVESFSSQLQKLRTGRAHPSILDHITVSCYGSQMPINQVANINIESAQVLTITPWDKSMVGEIEKAILASDLGLNPAGSGDVIRLPLPPLSQERRKELIKVAREDAEKARVSIRGIRRDANQAIKNLLKEKEVSEDESRKEEDVIQKITNDFISQIDQIVEEKEKSLLTI